ncbi:MAG TPA: hypothetical protein PKE03_06715 [Bacteroidales bacterium]|nr:hypothetical protein [Bacteroidales bacterium]
MPAKVVKVLQSTGHNRVQLIKAIAQYVESEDTARRNALFFLISHMERQYAVEYQITDSSEHEKSFDPLQYADYQHMIKAWDSLSALPGGMIFVAKRYTFDRDTITTNLLLNTIDLAFQTKRRAYAAAIPDSIFLRYVLPYRVANEDLEDWRPLLSNYFSSIIPDTVPFTINQAARALSRHIDSTIFQEYRLLKNPNIVLPSQILKERRASPRDLAVFRVMALRSIGIPATLDYVPWLSDSLNSVWFASYYAGSGAWKPLLPEGFDERLLQDAGRIPKVYRRIYHTLDSSLFALKDTKKFTPPFLGHFHYLDVTNQYLTVRNISYQGPCHDEIIYLAVWNGKYWKPVDWAFCKGESAEFRNIGAQVRYAFTWVEKQGDHNEIKLIAESQSPE